ncbi:MAG: hypothetical protein F6K65_17105 [Moorea sp. SIO3C2]|nr:hypothetical protein [Moorena sp. SIO3C2]
MGGTPKTALPPQDRAASPRPRCLPKTALPPQDRAASLISTSASAVGFQLDWINEVKNTLGALLPLTIKFPRLLRLQHLCLGNHTRIVLTCSKLLYQLAATGLQAFGQFV